MKKLILTFLAIGSIAATQAQTAGSILIYGNVAFNSSKDRVDDGAPGTPDQETRTTSFMVRPGVGVHINPNFAVGLNINLQTWRQTYEPTSPGSLDVSRNKDIAVGPFIRYQKNLNNTFFIWGQANIDFLTGNTVNDYVSAPDVESTYNGFGLEVFPAIGVWVSKCMALNFSFGGIGIRTTTWDHPGTAEETLTDFGFNFGQHFEFGCSWTLGGSKHKSKSEPSYRSSDDDDDNNNKKKKSSDDDDE